MKHTFVLDANILMRVLKGNETARALWMAILRNCHKIAVSHALSSQYDDMRKRERKRLTASAAGLNTAKLVQQLVYHQEKAWWPDVPEQDPDSVKVRHLKDRFLQPLVSVSEGRLVTIDEETRKDLNGLTIEQALMLARETNGG